MDGSESKEITVHIYESEYRQIQAWVAEYQNLETGGDLFGLWADNHTAVVQLVLGPGEHCKRTGSSFYQDVGYLERVGNKLTNEQGLCHIGEWHSHHRLGLTRPSRGDKNTVWTNMKRYGINRFLLFIATIDGSWSHDGSIRDEVNVHGFLFQNITENNQVLREVKFEYIQGESPLRFKYKNDIESGAERVKCLEEMNVAVKDEEPEQPAKRQGICSNFFAWFYQVFNYITEA